MRKHAIIGLVIAMAWALCGLNLYTAQGEERKPGASRAKVGEVKNVDVADKKTVVIVSRELTFKVTDNTTIQRRNDAKTLADIKVGAKAERSQIF
jgi:hypothetical protein